MTRLTADQKYLITKSLDLWFWIENLQSKFHPIPERYDKHLYNKCKVIQRYVDKVLPESDIADGMLLDSIDSNLFLKNERRTHRSPYFGFDVIKGFVHNFILRELDYDPLVESPRSYKQKVQRMRSK